VKELYSANNTTNKAKKSEKRETRKTQTEQSDFILPLVFFIENRDTTEKNFRFQESRVFPAKEKGLIFIYFFHFYLGKKKTQKKLNKPEGQGVSPSQKEPANRGPIPGIQLRTHQEGRG